YAEASMVTNRVIRVDDDVYRILQKEARPFEDTPNSVLRRLLRLGDENANRADRPSVPSRRSVGHRNPQEAFRRPILEAIEELGGNAQVNAVLQRVEQEMKSKLTKF